MSAPYTKTDLVAELASQTGLSRRRVRAVLDGLTVIAYREAPRRFTVPGICRLDVIHRRERRVRNPLTGAHLLVGAHDVLRARPLRKARMAVAQPPPNLVRALPSAEAAAVSPPSAAPPAPASPLAPAAAPSPALPAAASPAVPPAPAALAAPAEEAYVSFRCRSCLQEIEAPRDMAGTASECPSCGNAIKIPRASEPGTLWGAPLPQPETSPSASPARPEVSREAMKSRTIRIELPDNF